MKIHTNDLVTEPLEITLTGQESWLDGVYSWFSGVTPGESPRLLSGFLRVSLFEDLVYVEGHLDFDPLVPCGRCHQPVPVELKMQVSRTYGVQARPSESRELDLNSADLDEFYLEQGSLDVADMVNELVQLELPGVVRHADDDADCIQGKQDAEGVQVWTTDSRSQSEAQNPFAVLKGLNLPSDNS